MKEFDSLMNTIKTLRAPGGCPWDIDQTPLSMRSDLVEECFEAVDAVTAQDPSHACEELGDLIFNALVLSYMYEQKGDFSVADVLSAVNEKIIRRHPHVFKDSEGKSQMKDKPLDSESVLKQWEKIKQNVEGRRGESVLDSVPAGFPPLLKAQKMLKKASKSSFEWEGADQALAKLEEELDEVRNAFDRREQVRREGSKAFTVSGGSPELNKAQLALEEETGDLLMAAVNYARMLNIDGETALNRANAKFYRRFTHVEKRMKEENLPMTAENRGKMLEFWQEAKNCEN